MLGHAFTHEAHENYHPDMLLTEALPSLLCAKNKAPFRRDFE
jgi:hypothetical protein